MTHLPLPMLHYTCEQMNTPCASLTTSSCFPRSPLWRGDGVFALESLKKSQALLLRIRHDVLDNPKTPAHSPLSRIAIYHAPLAAETPPREPKTVQKVQKRCRNHFSKVHCLPKLDRSLLSFGQCGKCRFFENFKRPTLEHDTPRIAAEPVLSSFEGPLPPVILSAESAGPALSRR